MPGSRNRLVHLVGRGLRRPGLVVPYLRRRLRNRRLRARAGSHPEFYRAVMADDVRRKSAWGAVGTPGHDRWMALGQLQFDYLTDHGLEPHHRLLEIGCGNLRAGWRFVRYLDAGNYMGVDISPEILLAAHQTIADYELQDKRPVVSLVDGASLQALPAAWFDVVHAHSVFSHTPPDVVEAYLREAWRVLVPAGFFDFTYNPSDADVWGFLDEDFYYPERSLLELCERVGYEARPMTGWRHRQAKIRAVKPAG